VNCIPVVCTTYIAAKKKPAMKPYLIEVLFFRQCLLEDRRMIGSMIITAKELRTVDNRKGFISEEILFIVTNVLPQIIQQIIREIIGSHFFMYILLFTLIISYL
jgi:hypothetical protein